MPTTCRPMRDEDIPALFEVMRSAFGDLDRRLGEEYAGPPPQIGSTMIRFRRTLATDPGGSWVAERDGRVVGTAAAILREGVWGCRCSSSTRPRRGTAWGASCWPAPSSTAPAPAGGSSSPRAIRGRSVPTRGSGSTSSRR